MDLYWDMDDPAHPSEWDGDDLTWDGRFVGERKNPHMSVKTGTQQMPDEAVLQLVESIIAGATGKTELANSPVTLAQLGTLKTEAETALSDEAQAENDLTVKSTARENAFSDLRGAIRRFAIHADSVYDGDKESLQEIGLDVREPGAPIGPLDAPQNLRSFVGQQEGTVELAWKAVYGRHHYLAEWAPSPNGPWTQFYTGRLTRSMCANLTPGTEYWFRVRAEGTAGLSPWSDITRRRAA